MGLFRRDQCLPPSIRTLPPLPLPLPLPQLEEEEEERETISSIHSSPARLGSARLGSSQLPMAAGIRHRVG